jgi:putative inorganic carbon (hco3(-)) transporter
LLVPVAVIVFWLYSGDALRQRFEQMSVDPATNNQITEASGSAQQRKELLLESLRVTAQHPLLGVGPGDFEFVSRAWRVTHNSYTQISAEGGIPAFLLYVLILWRGIANLRDVSKYRKTGKRIRLFSMALGASLAGYLIGSFFASVAYQLYPYCLISYTSALRLTVHRNRTVSSRSPKPHPTPAEVEVPVWP